MNPTKKWGFPLHLDTHHGTNINNPVTSHERGKDRI